jgi:hypothetical protein
LSQVDSATGVWKNLAMTKRSEANAFWGVPFSDDLFSFFAFTKKNPKALEALNLFELGPLKFLAGGLPEAARFYNDPPEFVTVLGGMTDGLHWGYWFDAPGELEPVVVSYYANDAFALTVHGASLFDALRQQLDAHERDANGYLIDDPDSADDYRARLASYAKIRKTLPAKKKAPKRKSTAMTRSRAGIVVRAKQYRPLSSTDLFQAWNFKPTAAVVKKMVSAARTAADEGFPGTALKLGHDLWIYAEHQSQSVAMLDLAYQRLGRDVLRNQLKKASLYRGECDTKA